jgi:DNA-binding transcriptional ArsR family regulator
MNRRQADLVVAAFVGAALGFGVGFLWRPTPTQSTRMMGGSMMGTTGTTGVGTDPAWIALGAVLVAAVVTVPYLFVRTGIAAGGDGRSRSAGRDASAAGVPDADKDGGAASDAGGGSALEDGAVGGDVGREDGHTTDATGPEASESPTESTGVETDSPRALLDVLPEDERRVLEPVVASPGLTQIELRDRADFSKSKVSQTVSDLEKRGLLYRERQGRTYRVFPGGEIGGEERSPAE